MPTPKMQHCWYCGAELGVYVKYYGDRDTCGKRECEREVQRSYQAERDERRHNAEDDDYMRY